MTASWLPPGYWLTPEGLAYQDLLHRRDAAAASLTALEKQVRAAREASGGSLPVVRLRDPSAAELAEFRRTWLALAAAGTPMPVVLPESWLITPADPAEAVRAAIEEASPLACEDCKRDDLPVDNLLRCRYCAALAGLRDQEKQPGRVRWYERQLSVKPLVIVLLWIVAGLAAYILAG